MCFRHVTFRVGQISPGQKGSARCRPGIVDLVILWFKPVARAPRMPERLPSAGGTMYFSSVPEKTGERCNRSYLTYLAADEREKQRRSMTPRREQCAAEKVS